MQMCHVLWGQFCCSCMYTKTARKESQVLKESTWVVKLLCCWSACKCYDMETWFSVFCQHIPPTLLIYFLGNFSLVKPVDQQRRQLEVVFYSRCYIMGSGVGILARKISLALRGVVGSWITHYSLDAMVWPSNF